MEKLRPVQMFDLEYFFELSPDLLCIAGFDGFFKKINPAVSQTLGFSTEELFSRPINTFVHPEDQEMTRQKRQNIKNNVPLLNFENRYLSKAGEIVWLSWTSMPIKRDKVVFAIAKDITYKKRLEELWRVSAILGSSSLPKGQTPEEIDPSTPNQYWLKAFEQAVRKNVGLTDLTLNVLSSELAVSERVLFRRVQALSGLTPNRLVRAIRLQMAWDAINTGKYRTVSEISAIAGFKTPAYFSKTFQEIYGVNALDLLKS
ncbi:PAS domain S-box protein [Pedobacter duraquae]|nr:PAS domain S-box protein [Pedobacter duraquae]